MHTTDKPKISFIQGKLHYMYITALLVETEGREKYTFFIPYTHTQYAMAKEKLVFWAFGRSHR